MYQYYFLKDATEAQIDEPVGWDSFESVLKRSVRHGFTVEFSEIELTFYCGTGGYNVLLTEYEAEGNDGQMTFRQTYECNGNTETLYEGSVNFNSLLHIPGESITVNLDNVSFSHKLKTREKTKFSMGATVDLDGNAISPAEPERLNMHSRAILKQFDANDETDTTAEFIIPESTPALTQLYMQKGWLQTGIDEIEGTKHYSTNWQESDPVLVDEWLIDVKEAGTYTFDITLYYNLAVYTFIQNHVKDLEFRWILRIDNDEFPLTGQIWVPGYIDLPGLPGNYLSGDITAAIQKTVYLNPGQKVYLFAYQNHNHAYLTGGMPQVPEDRQFVLTTKATSKINISALTQTNASLCNVWPVKTVLNQLIYGATGLPGRLKSDYFNACGKQYYNASGFNIRQFPDKPLTLSREEAWQGLNPIFALGEGLTLDAETELVEIEQLEHFYQASEILKIDHPSDYSEEVATEYIYNSVEVGYEKSNTNEFNALDEFNSKREYQTPIRSFENRLTLNSKFVASMYAVETQRRKPYINASTASAAFDNDTFIFATRSETEVKSIGVSSENTLLLNGFIFLTAQSFVITSSANNNGTYKVTFQTESPPPFVNTILAFTPDLPAPGETDGLVTVSALVAEKDELFESTANVLSPDTIYNGRITPFRNLLRWGNVLNSGLWFKDRQTNHLRFVSGEGNVKFQHRFKSSETCREGDPDRLLLSENDSPELTYVNRFKKIWKPEYITFKAPLTAAEMQLIRQAHIPQVNAPQKHGYISVWDGEEYQQGYLLELRFRDADQTGELSSFKLIKKWDSGPASSPTREHGTEFGTEYN